jgi:hypothetical protein
MQMPKSKHHFNGQSRLLKKIGRIGYDMDPEGVCAGASMVAIESFINHSRLSRPSSMQGMIGQLGTFKMTSELSLIFAATGREFDVLILHELTSFC